MFLFSHQQKKNEKKIICFSSVCFNIPYKQCQIHAIQADNLRCRLPLDYASIPPTSHC